MKDPYLWLEDVLGDDALEWVEAQNARALKTLGEVPVYDAIYERTLSIFDSSDRIPMPTLRGNLVYNFWQDKEHPRGILRRASLASYRTDSPEWETVLDIDAMAAADDIPWVYKGSDCLAPDYRRCLVTLSRGGSDAAEEREFDMVDRQFVDGGFFVPEAKSGVAWVDEDTLWVGTDWGEGSLTESGYPRVVKEWKRGTPLSEARTLFEAEASDIGLWPVSFETAQGRISMLFRSLTFFTSEAYLGLDGRLVRLDLPVDSDFKAVFQDHAVFSLRSAWTTGGRTYAAGSLLAIDLDDLLAGRLSPSVVFAPSARVSLDSVATTRDRLLITTLDNVRSRLYRVKFADDEWTKEEMALPGLGAASIADASDDSDIFFYTYEDFLTPDSLYLSLDGKDEKLKSLPAFFDFDGIEVSQIDATSRDGTNIPYFFVAPKGFEADGTAPTLLYAYGGFEVSQRPSYSATVGTAWLERGGAFVVANIRGGGEFGPEWHQAAVQENHHRNFEDFIAVAEDLVATNRTSPNHLGIMGGSQGGLLVGGTFTLRPELFNAAVSQVPLLDMKRYHKLLAGASWISEYGDPDNPEHWAYIQTWSPYHLLREDATYPEVFFWTTTRDDRVHPGHARKMVAKLIDMKHPVLYFENTEGGHGSGSTNAQRAQIDALQFAYLWKKLGG